MPSKKVTPVDEVAAAFLFAKGEKQAKIAKELGLSAPVVSRLINSACKKNYLVKEFRFLQDNVGAETLEAMRRRLSRSDILERLDRFSHKHVGHAGPLVRVFDSARAADGTDAALAVFAAQAAPYIRDLLLQARVCGVTWGRMLLTIVRAMRSLRVAPMPHRLEVIPLAGEPLGNEPTMSSSSTLAVELGRMMTGDEDYHGKSLTMVPALVPLDFTPYEQAAVYKLIDQLPDYRAIFGRKDAIAGGLDCILTSLGRKPLGFRFRSMLKPREQKLFAGDMGGVLLPRPGLRGEKLHTAKDIEARWTGLKFEHVKACAERARNPQNGSAAPTGVVLVATEADRAPVVLEVIRRGLVNHLVMDSQLAYALSQLDELKTESEMTATDAAVTVDATRRAPRPRLSRAR